MGQADPERDIPLILAIDQGTTSTRAILFDTSGAVRHIARRDLRQIYPQPGWVEHDPEEIWQAVVATCREAIAAAEVISPGRPVAALGITNQRETTVLWRRADGKPVHNAIVWQDRRTAPICERWRAEGFAAPVAAKTGLVIDPYFSAS
ncbi:MAG TPA: FGGY family carbohydrate kinase, partial [Stellaceae bacterium]|nr:FGGY family carbohydrate kinase [Stellaceae bacterium]